MAEERTEQRIPLAEEELHLEKRETVTGRVRVRTLVENVEEVIRTSLEEHPVEIERVPIDREIDAVPQVRTEGDTTIIPVVEEVLVVEKRLVLKEELRIRSTSRTKDIEVPITLRKQRAVVKRIPSEDDASSE